MHVDDPSPEPELPDPIIERLDPGSLKDAHGRTGRMLKQAGLPFEDDEFDEVAKVDDADGDETSGSSDGSSDE